MRSALVIGIALAAFGAEAMAQSREGGTRWRSVATQDDFRRLHDWREAFAKALAQAKAANPADVSREGKLLDPDAAIDPAAVPDGRYSCRTIKIGVPGEPAEGLAFVSYPAFECEVATQDGVTSLHKLGGSQRLTGRLYEDDTARKVFLGTMMYSDETSALRYGRDADRDIIGALEQIGPKRWRLVMPYPRFESLTDVMELVPVG